MPASPVVTGDNHDGLACTWLRDDQTPVDITGAAITFRWKNSAGTVNGNGVVTITDGPNGKFKYVWGSIELALVGDYTYQWKGVWLDGTILHDDEAGYTFKASI